MKISVCMIVKNESPVLARCLDCVKQFADEIIIVDTGSKDNTKDIAKLYTDKVYDFKWCDDFSVARNYSFKFATSDYIMWLDADDIIEYSEIEKLNQLKLNMDADVYMLKYATNFDSIGNPTFVFERERILKRGCGFQWEGFVHEAIPPRGKIEHLDICIQHRKIKADYTKRNLNLYRKALKRNVTFNARDQYYYARELFYWGYYKKSIKEFKKFFTKPNIFLPNKIDAFLIISKCYENLNRFEDAKKWLIQGLDFMPNAEIICELANIYERNKNYVNAIYFYESALNVEKPNLQGIFIREEYYYLIPLLQLTKLYYNLGNYEKAKKYHLKACELYKNNEKVQYNMQFFKD